MRYTYLGSLGTYQEGILQRHPAHNALERQPCVPLCIETICQTLG